MILIRHGQSEWNAHYSLTRVDPNIPDPPLTTDGRRQAAEAAAVLASLQIERLLASPYRRTLETADIIGNLLRIPIFIEPLVRERVAFSCDIGTPRSILAPCWPHLAFDHVEEMWWSSAEESVAELDRRCSKFRVAARQLPDWPRVAVVSHWGFIRGITGVETRNGEWIRFDPHGASSGPVPATAGD